ncbi:HNH endonuclease signature motif containing protein [Microvirga sp. VF16]|uniref:HNH endonuclease signature motif containing protein n=1 Tax=Microvirga sp. VF16 TaxID=2807101 RepID=UPI00193CFD1E|nr:HNH endonuclease signature motif containing protein [Microvirga sp. VF16]QRM35621.1 HNH endonuclease [Microvirga sp. VF16]
MPFLATEDVGTTVRRKLTPSRRLAVWERTGGRCVVCEAPIDGIRERWIAEHIRALELGGADDLSNMGPAHEICALAKTRDDHRRTARAKRQKIRHIGAEASKRPLPFGRASPWKRTLSGRVVPR